jgi:hypothetical protein
MDCVSITLFSWTFPVILREFQSNFCFVESSKRS